MIYKDSGDGVWRSPLNQLVVPIENEYCTAPEQGIEALSRDERHALYLRRRTRAAHMPFKMVAWPREKV